MILRCVRNPEALGFPTGYRPDYRFLELPVIGASGAPVHRRGATGERGLFLLGLPWQHTRGSALLGWVGRDADYIASQLALPESRAASHAQAILGASARDGRLRRAMIHSAIPRLMIQADAIAIARGQPAGLSIRMNTGMWVSTWVPAPIPIA